MTRTLIRDDLQDIDAFFSEFSSEASTDDLSTDASIELLINQLEASFDTAEALSSTQPEEPEDLRVQVQDLARRLESIATELAQINQQLQ